MSRTHQSTWKRPERSGLYDPAFEHESCGVGFVAQIKGLRSHNIMQDADVILFIYRDEYYNKEKSTRPGVAEVIVAKQRNGPTGSVELSFQGEFTLFGDLARREHSDGYY